MQERKLGILQKLSPAERVLLISTITGSALTYISALAQNEHLASGFGVHALASWSGFALIHSLSEQIRNRQK